MKVADMTVLYQKIRDFYRGRRVLVTGGAGFIGSNLVESLVMIGAKVFVIDNLSSGKIANLKRVLHKVHFFCDDLTKTTLVDFIISLNFEVIFHLAAISSVPWAEASPDVCKVVNEKFLIDLTHNLLTRSHVLPKIVFSSSSSVYGNVSSPSNEDADTAAASVYAKSKLAGEFILKDFALKSGASVFALRYYNVFGRHAKKAGAFAPVVSLFKKLISACKAIKIFGSGLQVRDYVPVSKVVFANLMMPCSGLQGFNVFNIASGNPMSLLELVRLITISSNNCWPEVLFLPARPGDVEVSMADTSKYDTLCKSLEKAL